MSPSVAPLVMLVALLSQWRRKTKVCSRSRFAFSSRVFLAHLEGLVVIFPFPESLLVMCSLTIISPFKKKKLLKLII
jgi:hypothetical protein